MNTTCSTITSWDIRQQFGDWMSPKKKNGAFAATMRLLYVETEYTYDI
jgi:hypothetical protein